MYHCFNLRADDVITRRFQRSLENSQDIQLLKETTNMDIHGRLDDYITDSQENRDLLDGDKMQSGYFADVPAQIFLSHSHQDENLALWIKGYLESNFQVQVFVDSCVWGYCNDLLKKIDDTYCLSNSPYYKYDYDKRNNSTAIVHMMLSTALTQMMDKCECIMFLNTQQSNLEDCYGNDVQTASPWIYHELSTMKVLRKKVPTGRPEPIRKRYKFTEDKALSVTHTVSLAEYPQIGFGDLYNWLKQKRFVLRGTDLLDALYEKYDIKR